MKSAVLLIAMLFTVNAFAARQTITCTEMTKSKKAHAFEASFDPAVSLEEVWKKNPDRIISYELGKDDKDGKSTARATLTIPKGNSLEGDYKFVSYYNVNTKEKAGSGYSNSDFGGEAYRSIHGSSKDQMDMMFYYPESAVGQDLSNFSALVTYQPSFVDEGYMNVKMICQSIVK